MINKDYIISIVPNEKIKIKIRLIEYIECIKTNDFLRNYKISRIFRGKFFIKRLIKKIFKYKIKQDLIWKTFFWDDIVIHKISTKIIIPPRQNLSNMEKEIFKYTLQKRVKNINKYREMILNGYDLGYPLFISGRLLNYLGAEVNDDKILILDGSRRLVANIICECHPKILLLDFNNES